MAASYDVAVVLDNTTLDKGMSQLYANPDAKTKLFSGTESNEKMKQAGITSVDWSINAAPTFTLSPPTQKQWDNKSTFFEGTHAASPPADSFQVELTSFSTKLNLKTGGPVDLSFNATVFAEVNIVDNKVKLGTVGVLPKDVPGAGEIYLQIIGAIVYAQVVKLLAGYTIPSQIEVEGFEFTTPVATVTGGHIVAATNLTSTGAPPDISGVAWPNQKLAVLASRNMMNALIDKYSTAIVQQMDNKKVDKSGDNWAGSYSLDGGISNASVKLGTTITTIDVSATVSATASLGVSWWLVPAACAMESASNLL